MNNRKGQNAIEYILLVASVLVLFIFFLNQNGPFHEAIKKSLFGGTIKQIQSATSEIKL